MALKFIDLTNETLRRINEVALKEGTFDTPSAVHVMVKDAVNSSIRDIQQGEFQWPFNHVDYVQTLTPGIGTYELPSDCKTVDWDSFYLKRDDSLDVGARKLRCINYDQYMSRYFVADQNADEGDVPAFVYRTQGNKFGVTPFPDLPYQVGFEYWGYKDTLTAANDTTTIPDQFRHVIVDGALYYVYMFRNNSDNVQLIKRKFDAGVSNMRTLLINRYDYVFDTRI